MKDRTAPDGKIVFGNINLVYETGFVEACAIFHSSDKAANRYGAIVAAHIKGKLRNFGDFEHAVRNRSMLLRQWRREEEERQRTAAQPVVNSPIQDCAVWTQTVNGAQLLMTWLCWQNGF